MQTAFYHWKSNLAIQREEQDYLTQLAAQKIYLRCFDVDWDQQQQMAVPIASLQMDSNALVGIQIVPTIFVTNRTLIHLPGEQLDRLATQISQKLQTMMLSWQTESISEVQIDCDWTLKTKAKYFRLLTTLTKALSPQKIQLSSTIRLHQIKYFSKTGVPPVARGMLMFYNMGDLDKPQAYNTILDLSIAEKYLAKAAEYPLALDVALPLFSWGVVYRDDKMVQLINGLKATQLKDRNSFLKLDENHFKVLESTYLNGDYLYQEDHIRLERVTTTSLVEAAKLLANHLKPINRTVSFYHLDPTIIKNYPYETLETVCHYFR
ncbi:MAG: hypothetical protein AB8G15_10885 [Saprospiraceae bacterium]